jgi:transcriptional regulator with XRE-family HTH domain
VTVPLSASSARRIGAMRFGTVLREEMVRADVGQVRLARSVGISSSAIGQYRLGHNVPTVEVAQRLDDALGIHRLAALARAARLLTCDNCGREFHVEAGSPKRYCTPECRRVSEKKREPGPEATRNRAIVAERSLSVYRGVVAAMCASCEPSGLCRTTSCPLRSVSPLPLNDHKAVPLVGFGPKRPKPEGWVHLVREANARRWTPEARDQQRVAMKARHAAMTDAEREAFGQAVSAGRKRSEEAA